MEILTIPRSSLSYSCFIDLGNPREVINRMQILQVVGYLGIRMLLLRVIEMVNNYQNAKTASISTFIAYT